MTLPPTCAPLLRTSKATAAMVLLLHVAVAGLLWRMPAWDDRQPAAADQPPLVVRLLWKPALAESAVEPMSAGQRPRPAAKQQPTTSTAQPQAITALAADAAAEATPSPALPAAAQASPPEVPKPAPLNLSLPRGASAPWRQRNPALDDPRANTAKLTLEQKLANAMGGDGTWVMERVDLNTIRYRRGSECVQMIRSRAGQLELGGGAFRDSWLAGNC